MNSITVTTQKAINYGAVLQSFALQQIQEELGIKNEILNLPRLSKLFMPIPRKLSKQTLIACAINLTNIIHLKEQKKLRKEFDRFLAQYIFQTKEYNSLAELEKDPPLADFYINGSDQVFGLRGEQDNQRMLNFGPDHIHRFSYAGSLGEYDWDNTEEEKFSKLLSRFELISVREEYARDYLKKFVDRDIEVHMDPTFIISPSIWDKMAVKPSYPQKYALAFPLVGNNDMQNVIYELQKLGYKVVCIQTNSIRRYKADRIICDASPEEFLGWIKYADIILSSSFHGTAFSIIFQKPFYSFIKNYKSQRFTDMLKKLKLEDRIYGSGTQIKFEIDYSDTNKILSIERQRTQDYFRKIYEICEEK